MTNRWKQAQRLQPYFTRVHSARRHWKAALYIPPFTPRAYPGLRQSSIFDWKILVAVGLASGFSLLLSLPLAVDADSTIPTNIEGRVSEETLEEVGNWNKMTGEALSGRPGTLTAEQELKLREFWIATLQVFGIWEKNAHSRTSTEPSNGAEANATEKPKKKRLGIFGKKKGTGTNTAPPTDPSVVNVSATDDDKYGQTKQYNEALANQSPEVLRATFWSMVKHDHPDALLLRFLRARKWDVEKALVMMVSTMNWRATEMHVDEDIIKTGESGSLEASKSTDPAKKKFGDDFLAQVRMGKSFLHGTDKAGRPMCFIRVRLHKQGEQSEESLERYTVFVIETARMILAPPVDTACIVFDMTGFSMANMDYTPVKFMIKCFEANYPESLGVVLVHKAPWIFQGIWKIIKGWLDPVVASKVNFTNSVTDMEDFIARNHIIKELGGDDDWAYQYLEPVAGENSRMTDTETREKLLAERQKLVDKYEQATLDWIENTNASTVSDVKNKRNLLANELRDDYWRLDPYLRARTVYDRMGMLQEGGKLQFYPPQSKPVAAAVTDDTPKVETSTDDLD